MAESTNKEVLITKYNSETFLVFLKVSWLIVRILSCFLQFLYEKELDASSNTNFIELLYLSDEFLTKEFKIIVADKLASAIEGIIVTTL